ncbi:sorting nexin-21-like [Petromyzon marinus]|uniref:Sorting nexin-21-like n=1 Tax=Petromyzon marinus TaxID=7757 RepID=A0AAJ7XBJ5_PETMA|nr:sorting nexin-21-like [Petromyzon marinus]XP_032827183.1 sorting nexin-21-like [Petromyzon marinus]
MAMASKIIRKLRGGSKKSRGRGGAPGPEARPGDLAPGLEEEEDEEEAYRVAARLGGTLSFDSELPRDLSSGDSAESERATPEDAECGGLPAEVELAAGGGRGGGDEQAAGGDRADDSTRLTSALQASFRCKRDQQRRQQQRGDSLTFEVVAANVVQESGSKYVLYTVLVVTNGCLDDKKASINRRYSDFSHLHKTLLRSAPANDDKSDDNDDNMRYRRQFARQLSSVSFPSKKIAGNFTAVTIARRSRAFEQYLSHITQIPSVRGTPSLWAFFCLPDLKAGHSAIRGGDYDGALQSLTNALHLQEKIIPPPSHKWELPPTLSAMAVCCQALGRRNEAQGHCQRALQVMGSADDEDDDEDANTAAEDQGGPGVEGSGGAASRKANGGQWGDLLVALLSANVHLSWQLGLDKRESEARLQRLQGRRSAGCRSPLSLKEWVIQQHLQ